MSTLPPQIADRIGAWIVEEQLTPGNRLKETELAKTFRVSRATIREALRILEHRGLVSIVPQRGAMVTQYSTQEVQDLFEIRAVLLGLASRRLALDYSTEIGHMLDINYRTLEAARGDAGTYARASAEFVAELTLLCGNQELATYIDDFALRIGRYTRLGFATPERRTQSLADWRRLIRAIQKRDAQKAEECHRILSGRNLAAALAELDRREGRPVRRKPRSL